MSSFALKLTGIALASLAAAGLLTVVAVGVAEILREASEKRRARIRKAREAK